MASLADILTTQKNGVVAINGLIGSLVTLASSFGTPQLLARGAATTSVKTLYTSPAKVTTYVKDITVCNTSGAAQTFTIYLVPFGGTASAASALFFGASIAANTTTQWSGLQVLEAGGTIQALASSTACTFNISGAVY